MENKSNSICHILSILNYTLYVCSNLSIIIIIILFFYPRYM